MWLQYCIIKYVALGYEVVSGVVTCGGSLEKRDGTRATLEATNCNRKRKGKKRKEKNNNNNNKREGEGMTMTRVEGVQVDRLWVPMVWYYSQFKIWYSWFTFRFGFGRIWCQSVWVACKWSESLGTNSEKEGGNQVSVCARVDNILCLSWEDAHAFGIGRECVRLNSCDLFSMISIRWSWVMSGLPWRGRWTSLYWPAHPACTYDKYKKTGSNVNKTYTRKREAM